MSLPRGPSEDGALLAAEALSILRTASEQGTLTGDRARAFARACLERDPVGRLALAVLEGGVFAPARLVELAERVADETGRSCGGQRNAASAERLPRAPEATTAKPKTRS